MNRGAGSGGVTTAGWARLDRWVTAVLGAFYCLGTVYVVPPIETAVVLDELHLGCDARRGIRDLERLLGGAASAGVRRGPSS